MSRSAVLASVLSAVLACLATPALARAKIAPFSSAAGPQLPAPWRIVTLPKIPRHTEYTLVDAEGRRVVRAEADASYANVVHPLNADVRGTPILHFAWRVDRFPAESDLSTRRGDDVAAKMCILFDVPLERLSFLDRTKVELGRRLFEPDLPAATICYVWDRTLPRDTWLDNAYTDRVKYLVLRTSAGGDERRWFDERRDLRSDFARAFPLEAAAGLPPVLAVAFATDADNTGGHALAWYGDIALAAE
jgi:hypothetical protein